MKKYKSVYKRKKLGEKYILNQKKKILLGIIDILVLQWVKDRPVCGQDIRDRLQKEVYINIGPGTLYPILYNLQNKGLIESKLYNKKRMYFLTKEGKALFIKTKKDYFKTQKLILNFLK